MRPDPFADVASIIHPLPDPPEKADGTYQATGDDAERGRRLTAERLRRAWEEGGEDPLLSTLASVRRVKEEAETQLGHLIAYGREFAGRRPYTLNELAQAAGMSVSGVRTGYDHHDVEEVAHMIAGRPHRQAIGPDNSDEHEVEIILNDFQRRGKTRARSRVNGLFHLLSENGWTPYPPDPSARATKAGKGHVRWVRQWTGGTTVTLYQGASSLGTSSDGGESQVFRFWVDYAVHEVDQVAQMLAEFTARIDALDQGRP